MSCIACLSLRPSWLLHFFPPPIAWTSYRGIITRHYIFGRRTSLFYILHFCFKYLFFGLLLNILIYLVCFFLTWAGGPNFTYIIFFVLMLLNFKCMPSGCCHCSLPRMAVHAYHICLSYLFSLHGGTFIHYYYYYYMLLAVDRWTTKKFTLYF